MVVRSDSDWINLINSDRTLSNPVFAELYELMVSLLPVGVKDSRFEFCEQVDEQIKSAANLTLEYVSENLQKYDGSTPFLKWVLNIAVRQLLYELRVEKWKIDSKDEGFPQVPEEWHAILTENEFLQFTHNLFKQELSESQRIAIRSMVMFRMPKEEVMRLLLMERCDYFKMIHDARLRIKRRLQNDSVVVTEQLTDL